MSDGFDQDYWESHWRDAEGSGDLIPPNPYLVAETSGLVPGTALDAGCGEGAEARWLAAQGWQVTAADISSEALDRARSQPGSDTVRWVRADLGTWEPGTAYDLVTTHYAHPAMPQLDFYDRVARWVSPGGTLLVVGHLQSGGHGHGHGEGHGHGHREGHDPGPPAHASVTAADVAGRLDPAAWDVRTAQEPVRSLGERGGHEMTLHDVVVRAVRRR